MKCFHDSEDFRWNLKINLKTVKRVYDETGVDLLQPAKIDEQGRSLSYRLMTEDLLLGEVVVALIGDQIDDRRETADVVRERIGAKEFLAIQEAFFAEYADFFEARNRAALGTAIRNDYETIRTRYETLKNEISEISNSVGTASNVSPPAPESAATSAT